MFLFSLAQLVALVLVSAVGGAGLILIAVGLEGVWLERRSKAAPVVLLRESPLESPPDQ